MNPAIGHQEREDHDQNPFPPGSESQRKEETGGAHVGGMAAGEAGRGTAVHEKPQGGDFPMAGTKAPEEILEKVTGHAVAKGNEGNQPEGTLSPVGSPGHEEDPDSDQKEAGEQSVIFGDEDKEAIQPARPDKTVQAVKEDPVPVDQGLNHKTPLEKVPEVGLEPTWSCPRGILSPLRLPISPLRPSGQNINALPSVKNPPGNPGLEVRGVVREPPGPEWRPSSPRHSRGLIAF